MMTHRPPKAPGKRPKWQCMCRWHDFKEDTICTRTLTVTAALSDRIVLRRLKRWVLHAHDPRITSRETHLKFMRKYKDADIPADDVLDGMREPMLGPDALERPRKRPRDS